MKRYLFVSKIIFTLFEVLAVISLPFFLFVPMEIDGAAKADLITISFAYYILNIFLILGIKLVAFVIRTGIYLFGYEEKENRPKTTKFIRGIWFFHAVWTLALMGYAAFMHDEAEMMIRIFLMALGLLAVPALSFIGYRSMVKFWEE